MHSIKSARQVRVFDEGSKHREVHIAEGDIIRASL